jgi:hypothetical protein
MKIRKAALWGITTIILGYFLSFIAQKSFDFWAPITKMVSSSSLTCQWVLSIALTAIAVTVIGYILMLLHPVRLIINRILKVKARQAQSIVLVRWGGVWFYGWLTGTIECDGKKLYRITVPSAPVPISAQLLLVSQEDIMFTNITKTDHFTQLGSLGFDKLDNKIRFWPPAGME